MIGSDTCRHRMQNWPYVLCRAPAKPSILQAAALSTIHIACGMESAYLRIVCEMEPPARRHALRLAPLARALLPHSLSVMLSYVAAAGTTGHEADQFRVQYLR